MLTPPPVTIYSELPERIALRVIAYALGDHGDTDAVPDFSQGGAVNYQTALTTRWFPMTMGQSAKQQLQDMGYTLDYKILPHGARGMPAGDHGYLKLAATGTRLIRSIAFVGDRPTGRTRVLVSWLCTRHLRATGAAQGQTRQSN